MLLLRTVASAMWSKSMVILAAKCYIFRSEIKTTGKQTRNLLKHLITKYIQNSACQEQCKGYDTVNMASLNCSLVSGENVSGVVNYQPVIGTGKLHSAMLQVAFAFDLDLSEDLRLTADSLSIIESDSPGTDAKDREKIRKSYADFGAGRYSKINPEDGAEDSSKDDDNLAVDLQVLEGHPRFNKEWSDHMATLDLIDQEERERYLASFTTP